MGARGSRDNPARELQLDSSRTTTMGSEQGLKSAKVDSSLLPATQVVQPKKACRFTHRCRAIAVGALIGVVLWFAHKRHTFTPESWLEGHLDILGYDESESFTSNGAEELFL